jgi:cytochrome c553
MRAFLLTLACLVCVKAMAADTGSVEAGRTKAAVCAACHGPEGISTNAEWPNLAGQHASYIARQIAAFKSGARTNPLMSGIAAGLSEQDAADLGAYFASFKRMQDAADPGAVRTGQRLYRGGNKSKGLSACIACHGPNGDGNAPGAIPAVGGQHATYTIAQLKAYAAGERKTDQAQIMRNIAALLGADEMQAIAGYLQGLH